jgi:hypothetical protein
MKENDFHPHLFADLLKGVDRRRHRPAAWTVSELRPLERGALLVAFALVIGGLVRLILVLA